MPPVKVKVKACVCVCSIGFGRNFVEMNATNLPELFKHSPGASRTTRDKNIDSKIESVNFNCSAPSRNFRNFRKSQTFYELSELSEIS